MPDEDQGWLEALGDLAFFSDFGGLRASDEIKQPPAFAPDEQGGLGWLALEEPDTGEDGLPEVAFARAEAEGAGCFENIPDAMRGRESLQQKLGIERNTAVLAQTAQQPDEIARGYGGRLQNVPLSENILGQCARECYSPKVLEPLY